ncbi:SpoIIE family protein phosphatase [Oscillatoria sp. CS-180]|uniref:SpoIIE family protein phosphatase n=1 Tax=Oscillatoria sp. CS-180 TaxID=3021720 RepID=UPI00232CB4B8|nr:SpoIIE family protein phosphatase [Oscillatoria sp. CS-180]MDB9527517.1 SpoIIE family protein phosphatase [Oscillatoria sp. CS-180]
MNHKSHHNTPKRSHQLNRLQLWRTLRNLKIGRKLTLGFGSLVAITLLVVVSSYLAGQVASSNIQRTQDLRVPTTLASANAQENLLKMLSNIRAYLATGEPEYRYRYQQTRQAFEADLAQLERLFSDRDASAQSREQLEELTTSYRDWLALPDQLIALQNNLTDNQPALKILDEQGDASVIVIQREMGLMLEEQELRSPSRANTILLRDMAEFRNTFSLALAALQSYLVTREPAFRFEYNALARANQLVWEQLLENQTGLTDSQRNRMTAIAKQRQAIAPLPEQMFDIVDSDQYRQDLFLFQEQAEPLAESMLNQLKQIVTDQQVDLAQELQAGSRGLALAQWQTLLGGLLAVGVGLAMVKLLQQQIAEPIKRLTEVTSRIQAGDLDAKAPETSKDEVGDLARSFNSMAAQLKESLETLEDRVEERTAELASANEQILALNERLKAENLRMGAELDVARQIQQMILPKAEELENVEGLDIAGYMEPADEVGGDYYDVLQTEGIVTLGIGDVTGHGLESGLLMLMTQTAVRTLQEIREYDLVRFLDTLNRTIYRNVQRMNSDRNLTLTILNYSEGRVSISGQHEETLVVRAEGTVERIDTMDLGLPIGLDDDIAEFIDHAIVELQPGDGIVLYTDGIPEAYNPDKQQYGLERLCEMVSKHWQNPAEQVKQAIIDDVCQFIDTQKVFDDITLLVFKRQDVTTESLPDPANESFLKTLAMQ